MADHDDSDLPEQDAYSDASGDEEPLDEEDYLPEDDEAGLAPETSTALPRKVEAWRRRSAAGAILTGFALGLQEALENRKDEPTIMVQTTGDPPKDLPVEADFEYGRPRQSVVQIRPWLLDTRAKDGESGATEAPDDAGDDPAPGS